MPRREMMKWTTERNESLTWRQRIGQTLQAMRSSWSGPLMSNSPELARWFGSSKSTTGMVVTESTALSVAAVWRAVTLISGQVAALPLKVYQQDANGAKRPARGHPVYRLLHDAPNAEQTAFTARELLQSHVLLSGNAYAEIQRDTVGRPIAIWPLTPERVTPFREAGTLRYRIANVSRGEAIVEAADMLHVPGLGHDGTVGYSVVHAARESLGLAVATEKFGATFFGNGATFGGVISYPGPKPPELSEKGYREQIEARHQGVDRAHKVLALYNGATFSGGAGIPPEDAQFLETRKFQVTEIARWFGLPPHKLGDLDRATFSNIEQQSLEFLSDCLTPWLKRWEQELTRKLIADVDRGRYVIEHVTEGLLRGDAQGRAAFYQTMSSIGAMTINEIRQRENLPPIEGGDRSRP